MSGIVSIRHTGVHSNNPYVRNNLTDHPTPDRWMPDGRPRVVGLMLADYVTARTIPGSDNSGVKTARFYAATARAEQAPDESHAWRYTVNLDRVGVGEFIVVSCPGDYEMCFTSVESFLRWCRNSVL